MDEAIQLICVGGLDSGIRKTSWMAASDNKFTCEVTVMTVKYLSCEVTDVRLSDTSPTVGLKFIPSPWE
jgi:hypothetical protein